MSTDAAIQAALYGHLLKLNLPTAMKIAPEGRNFDAKGNAYLRPTYLPAEAGAPHIAYDREEEHVGLYQIDVFWPINTGIAAPLAVADAIRTHYDRGLRFFLEGIDLRVNGVAYALPAMQETALLQIPVRVPWWACVTPA